MTGPGDRYVHPRHVMDYADIFGQQQQTLSVSAVAAQTAALEEGIYDLWCDEERVYIKIGPTADDVTAASGDPIFLGNKVPYFVRQGHKIGGILVSGTGTLRFHKVA